MCVAGSTDDAGDVFARVGEALPLIAKHGPRFSVRLRRDVKRLLFADVSGGRYLAGLHTYLIGVGYTRRVALLDLAMTPGDDDRTRGDSRATVQGRIPDAGACPERIERICIGAEITFAQRVPGSKDAVEKTRALLPTPWWTPEESTEATLGELSEQGVPTWLTKLMAWVSTRTKVH